MADFECKIAEPLADLPQLSQEYSSLSLENCVPVASSSDDQKNGRRAPRAGDKRRHEDSMETSRDTTISGEEDMPPLSPIEKFERELAVAMVVEEEPCTQPACSSQELLEHESMVRRQRSSIYATLHPLVPAMDTIQLSQRSFVMGRAERDESIDYCFRNLRRTTPRIYGMMSKRQCSIERLDGESLLSDLSRNGTYVNQQRIGDGSVILKSGDAISFGHSNFFVFVYDDDRARVSQYPEELEKKYIITNTVLGTGGYGKVVLGKIRSRASDCVAIKMLAKRALSKRFSRSPANEKEIQNEVDVMLKIKHPNCMRFEEWVETSDKAFIVLEYVGGGEFFDRITDEKFNGRGMGEKMTKFYAYQILSAVEYLHANGITHRDIKPENILLADKNDYTVAKLSDFGLSKKAGDSGSMRTFCGTPSYIAPEMLENGNETYTPAIDVWSTGVVLFTAIVGYPPFSDQYDDLDMNDQIKMGRLILTRAWKEISSEAQDLIKKMLRIDPRTRVSAGMALKGTWIDEKTKKKADECIANHVREYRR